MSRFKVPMTAVLIMFLLVDIVVGYRIWDAGWPSRSALPALGRESVKCRLFQLLSLAPIG